MTISPSTNDRLMAPSRARFNKQGLATTKPGSLLKKHIPVKTSQWHEREPGFLEADTVAHCGSSVAGMFAYTINCVDIASEWTEQRAVWSRGERGVISAINSIARAYKKNDNAHVENKNWTHVRQYLGFQRFDKPQLVDILNEMYTSEWNQYFNFFVPSVKLIQKLRVGSKIIKKHDNPH